MGGKERVSCVFSIHWHYPLKNGENYPNIVGYIVQFWIFHIQYSICILLIDKTWHSSPFLALLIEECTRSSLESIWG